MVCVGCHSVDGVTQRVAIRVNLQLSSQYFAHLCAGSYADEEKRATTTKKTKTALPLLSGEWFGLERRSIMCSASELMSSNGGASEDKLAGSVFGRVASCRGGRWPGGGNESKPASVIFLA